MNKKPTRVFDIEAAKEFYRHNEGVSQTMSGFVAGARWMFEKDSEEILRLEAKLLLAEELVKIIDKEGPSMMAWGRVTELCDKLRGAI